MVLIQMNGGHRIQASENEVLPRVARVWLILKVASILPVCLPHPLDKALILV
jgi:hypothetical protein